MVMEQMKRIASNCVALFITVPGKFISLKMRLFKLKTIASLYRILKSLEVIAY